MTTAKPATSYSAVEGALAAGFAIPNLLHHVAGHDLRRYERSLQDLTPEQTESLVKRSLKNNPAGQAAVLAILSKVFREKTPGGRQALSGKPVIISYLLDIVADLQSDIAGASEELLTEWQVYKLILDKLMLRDFTRSPLLPTERRKALQELALKLSSRGVVVAIEATFMEIIDGQFGKEFRRLAPEERRTRRSELFEDLRSSATLTRASGAREEGWIFSHNSLREFLTVEVFIESLRDRTVIPIGIPISGAMRSFVSSMPQERIAEMWRALSEKWTDHSVGDRIGGYLTLLWDSATLFKGGYDEALSLLGSSDTKILLNEISVRDIDFSCLPSVQARIVIGSSSTFSEVSFAGLNLSNSNFSSSIIDMVSFRGANLTAANFQCSLIFECDFSGATVSGADFRDIDMDSSIIVVDEESVTRELVGAAAVGYFRYNGAMTSDVEDIYVYCHHSKYSILKKICERISEQRHSQLRGLTQRGESRIDPPFARELVDFLVRMGWVIIARNDLVSATPSGRPVLQRIASGATIAPELVAFFDDHPDQR